MSVLIAASSVSTVLGVIGAAIVNENTDFFYDASAEATGYGKYLCHILGDGKVSVECGCDPEQAKNYNSGEWRLPKKVYKGQNEYTPTKIVEGGFRYCNFKTINLPQTISEMGYESFAYCQSMTTFTIPYLITDIAPSTFLDCRSLTNVYYAKESGSRVLGNHMIKTIGDHAFDSCINLLSFICPRTLINVGKSAFQKCETISSFNFAPLVRYTYYVKTDENPKKVYKKVNNAWVLQSGTLVERRGEPSATDEGAFCLDISEGSNVRLYIHGTSGWSYESTVLFDTKAIANVPFENNISVGSFAFSDCSSLAKLYFEENMNVVSDYAFTDCSEDLEIDYTGSSTPSFSTNWRRKYIATNKNNNNVGPGTGNHLIKININQSRIREDDNYAGLRYTIENGPIYIDSTRKATNKVLLDSSHEPYAKITEFIEPIDSVITGDDYDYNYYDASANKEIFIPDSLDGYPVKVIGSLAFNGGGVNLKTIHFNKSLVQICREAFKDCKAIVTLDFDKCISLKEISHRTFNETSVTSLSLPNCLEYIGARAFYKFQKGNYLSFKTDEGKPSHLKAIGERAFELFGKNYEKSGAMVNLVLPNSLNDQDAEKADLIYQDSHATYKYCAIARHCFDDADALLTVEMEEPTQEQRSNSNYTCSFGTSAFIRCTSLFRVKTSDNLDTIGASCFKLANSLRELFLTTYKASKSKYDFPWGRGNGTEINNYTSTLFVSTTADNLVIYVDGPAPKKLGLQNYGTKDIDYVTGETNTLYQNTPDGWNTERAGSYHFDTASDKTKPGEETIISSEYHYSRTTIPTYYNVDWQNSGVVYWNPKGTNSGQFADAPTSLSQYNSGLISFVKKKKEKNSEEDYFVATRYYCNSSNSKSEIDLSLVPTVYSKGYMPGYISSHLKTIGDEAFGSQDKVAPGKYFILPSSVENIGERAFYRYYADYRTVTVTYKDSGSVNPEGTYSNTATNGYCNLPSSVKTIGKNAFFNHRFTAIELGGNIKYLGKGAFYIKEIGDTNLCSNITIGNGDFFTGINNGIYYTGGDKQVLLYQSSSISGKMTIDDDTIAVGMHAAGNTKYSSIYAPNSLKTIYGGGFQKNKQVQSFVGGTGLEYIGSSINPDDNEVYDKDMPFGITDFRTFVNSTKYEDDYSRYGAFKNSTNLAQVNFRKMTNLKKIGMHAFANCTNLTKTDYFINIVSGIPTLYLPENSSGHIIWTEKDNSSFSYGTNNPSGTSGYYFKTDTYSLYHGESSTWSEITSGVAINEDSAPKTYNYYSDNSTYESVTSGVLDLSNCTNLRSIGRSAFTSCSNIHYVHLPNTTNKVVCESKLYVNTDPDSSVGASAVLDQNEVKILIGETVYQADNNKGGGLSASTHYSATSLGSGNSNVNLRYYYAKSIFDIVTTGSNIDNIRYWTDVSGGYRLLEGKDAATSYFGSASAATITISYDGNGSETTKASETKTQSSSTYTLPAANAFAAPSGKAFKCYEVTVGTNKTLMKAGAKLCLTDPNNITIKAIWKNSTITFTSNGGSGTMGSVTNDSNFDYYTLPENGFTAPNGKMFDHWSVGGVAYAPGDNVVFEDDSTEVEANWVDACTIQFKNGGGTSGGTMPSLTVAKNSYYTLPSCDFEYEGKFFSHWQIGSTNYNPGDIVQITDNTEITAVWDSPTISFDANTGSGTMTSVTNVGYEGSYTLPSCTFTAPSGKVFRCWSINGVEYAPGDVITITNNVTIYPIWETACTIAFNFGQGGSGSMSSITNYPANKTYTLPSCTFIAPEGKVFGGWSIGGNVYSPGDTITITGNTAITAIWKSTIILTFDSGTGGSGEMDDVEIAEDSVYTLPSCTFTAPDGKAFKGWEIDGKIYSTGDQVVLNSDTTITAIWENTVSISFDANGGTGTMSNENILAGTDYTLPSCTFTAPSGKVFSHWLIGNTIFYEGETVNITGNTIIKAVWVDSATVTFDANGGSGTMSAATIIKGSEYTLPECTFEPPSGKIFAGWNIGGNTYQPGDIVTISANTTVTAVWADE